MTTSNTYNQGIMHAAFQSGGKALCNSRRAIMSMAIAGFRTYPTQCKRCAAVLKNMDARAAAKAGAL